MLLLIEMSNDIENKAIVEVPEVEPTEDTILAQYEEDVIPEDELKKLDQAVDSKDKKKKVAVKEKEPLDPNDISNLEGIGPKSKEKLNAMGIQNISDLAVSNASDLYNLLSGGGSVKNVSLDYCVKLVVLANDYCVTSGMFDKPLVPSTYLLERSKGRKRFSTGDDDFDKFLGGGIESRAITEFYGQYGSGKTQICYCAATIAAAQGRRVLYIDTEDTYSPERIDELAYQKQLDKKTVHENIMVLKPQGVSMFCKYLDNLYRYVRDEKIELIIIDSIIALHKVEYLGRGLLAPRQQSLAGIMSKLIRIAEFYDIGVMITNHILANPDPYKPGTEVAAGGNSIAHYSTHRIWLKVRLGKHDTKFSVATMDDSPRYPRVQTAFILAANGLVTKDVTKGAKTEE